MAKKKVTKAKAPAKKAVKKVTKEKKCLRLISSVILGTIFGIICWLGIKYSPFMEYNMTLPVILGTILNRSLIGFCIGISNWKKMNYLVHGLVMGLIVTIPLSVYPLAMGAILMGFVSLEIAGAVYGLLTELIVTKLFKAPIA
jgi:hypothetical protein